MSILDNLNSEQKKAASQINGPSLILAGAGSGKTRTITFKIAYMVKELNIDPSSIIALTFTNKAANEMKERIESLVGIDARSIVISTFHSFAVRLLRKYGANVGFSSNFNIYDTDDSKTLIKNIIKKLDIDEKNTPSKILNRISKLKEKQILPQDLSEHMNITYRENRQFYEIYSEYQSELKKNNCMDFADILLNCKKLVENEYILNELHNTYKYILVDEYQDTNKLQYDIVHCLAKKNRNICVVGDEDQSIYAFRGADINNILNFKDDYKDAYIIKLEQNYRSTKNILNLANSVIQKNKSSLGKKLWSDNETGEKISIYRADNAYDEARFVAEIIKSNPIKNYSDFTILYRTNFQSRILEQELARYNIPCKIYGGLSFFQRKEIKDLFSYLTILNNPYDKINFERSITNPKRKIGPKTISKIIEYSIQNNLNLIDALECDNSTKVVEFKNTMQSLSDLVDKVSISELLKQIVDKTNYFEYLSNEENSEDRKLNVYELFNSIEEIEKNQENITLNDYLSNISLSTNSDSINNDNIVKLMTIHSSKGLEFDTVFLVGFEKNLFPSSSSFIEPDELEEERRLCYVAITRAKTKLYLTYANQRNINGITSYNNDISSFYHDMDKKYIHYINSNINTIEPKIYEENEPKISEYGKYKLGQIVTHKVFGKGKIIEIDSKSLTIQFDQGIKKISLLFVDKILV